MSYTFVNAKQAKTLSAIFTEPTQAPIEWLAIENLLLAIGSKLIEGHGSRTGFECKGLVASFHRPHAHKEAKRYQVRDAREFLIKLGVKP